MSTQTYEQHGQCSKQQNGFTACYLNLNDKILIYDLCNTFANPVHAGFRVLAKHDSDRFQ